MNLLQKQKKRKGSVLDVLSVLLVIITATILMTSFLNIIHTASVKEEVKQVCRKYILEMETTGYLNSTSQTQLIQELTALGVTDIDLSGTTFVSAKYGNPIYLSVHCNILGQTLDTSQNNMLSFFFKDEIFSIHVQRMSTSKN